MWQFHNNLLGANSLTVIVARFNLTIIDGINLGANSLTVIVARLNLTIIDYSVYSWNQSVLVVKDVQYTCDVTVVICTQHACCVGTLIKLIYPAVSFQFCINYHFRFKIEFNGHVYLFNPCYGISYRHGDEQSCLEDTTVSQY